ncbi:MAG TPA: hypothetical protein VMZ30_13695, partial [Pyrinomonadaceae bacterium]|nr:hypothetical protein [Pyrinomonadaceae bacterium]
QRGRETEIKRRLADCGYGNFVDIELKNGDSLGQKIEDWLWTAGAVRPSWNSRIRQIVYCCQVFVARVARYSRRRLLGDESPGGK